MTQKQEKSCKILKQQPEVSLAPGDSPAAGGDRHGCCRRSLQELCSSMEDTEVPQEKPSGASGISAIDVWKNLRALASRGFVRQVVFRVRRTLRVPHKGTPLPHCSSQGWNSKCGERSHRLEELAV